MKRAIFLLGVATLSTCAMGQTLVTIKSIDSAKTPVSISAKHMPIADAIKILAKSAGLSMEPSTPIRDLKVTLFVKDQPANVILDKIADVLDCRWETQGGVYFLARPRDEELRVESFLDAEDKEWRADAQGEVDRLANAASGSYSDFLAAMGTPAPDAGDTPPPDTGGPRRRGGPMHLPLINRTSVESYAAGLLFRNYGDSALSDLWAGQVVQTGMPSGDQGGRGNQGPGRTLLIRYDAYGSHQLEMVIPPQSSMERPFSVPGNRLPTPALAALPFGKSLADWPNLSTSTDTVLALPIQQVRLSGRPPASEDNQDYTPISNGRATISEADELEELFQKTGITIVADGFRIGVTPNRHGVSGSDVKGWLNSMVQEEQAYVKVEDGIVMVRHGGFWRLRQYEIPEETIRPLEKKGSSLTLDDYIGFVSQLTDAQAESLRAANPPVAGFALEPIRNALPALRFLSALPNDPPSGQPISYAAMGGNLQALYVSAVQQALFWGGTWAGSGPGPDPRRYAFLMSSSDVPGSGGLVAGTSFLFGSSRENAAQFQASARN